MLFKLVPGRVYINIIIVLLNLLAFNYIIHSSTFWFQGGCIVNKKVELLEDNESLSQLRTTTSADFEARTFVSNINGEPS